MPDIFLAKADFFSVIDDQAGDAHDVVLFPKLREMADVEDLGGDVAVFRGDSLGGGDQLRAQGYRIESLASIASMSDDGIVFRN